METKQQQVDRLKENENIFVRLSVDDQIVMTELGWRNLVTYMWTGTHWKWKMPVAGSLANKELYRVKQDYDVPVERDPLRPPGSRQSFVDWYWDTTNSNTVPSDPVEYLAYVIQWVQKTR